MAAESQKRWHQRAPAWAAAHPKICLTLLVIVALCPVLARPFNIDDPLFIWAARHIQAHPADPFGFDINWYGSSQPMWQITMNPPLACYYLAVAGSIFGWSEVALHTAFLLPAIALVLGTWRVARFFDASPSLTALVTFISPVVLVSSATVMCDVLMSAFWIWALVFWLLGHQKRRPWLLAVAVTLVCLAELTKYYGACLVPLLGAYSLVRERVLKRYLAWLLIPLAALAVYDFLGRKLYGGSLLFSAINYGAAGGTPPTFLSAKLKSMSIALTFAGGCIAPVTLFAAFLWRRRAILLMLAGSAVITLALWQLDPALKSYGPIIGSSRSWLEAQVIFWTFGGIACLVLAIADVFRNRTAESVLLALWVIGTLLFTGWVNWVVNARSLLPMAPAMAILLARRLMMRGLLTGGRDWRLTSPLLLSALVAALALRADCLSAGAVRQSARETFAKYGHGQFRFQGHWGFQYYMQELGATPLDEKRTTLAFGDVIAQPVNNVNFAPLNPEVTVLQELLSVPGADFMATMTGEVGAGFYGASRGPLPFAFGTVPPERVAICVLSPPSK